ncbi:TPA: hypothetical protein I7730_01320 [Vibrio vulnificus]|uniref:Uncharacterized protein n=1 Tax=Vibrio vulnificus TaxID=672 RepID=A0A8H9MVI4_VIBVL|nr:hypothetical protein [Vibrio vulnificus]HAS8538437.1 hypothetical protein [Vibrio vulnificus]
MLKKNYAGLVVATLFTGSAIGAQQELSLTIQSTNHEIGNETFSNQAQSSIGFRQIHSFNDFSLELDTSFSSIKIPDISYKKLYTSLLLSPALGDKTLIDFKAGIGAVTHFDLQYGSSNKSISASPTVTGTATINKKLFGHNFYLTNSLTSTIAPSSLIESSAKYECSSGVKKGRFDFSVGYKREKLKLGFNNYTNLSSDGLFISTKITF